MNKMNKEKKNSLLKTIAILMLLLLIVVIIIIYQGNIKKVQGNNLFVDCNKKEIEYQESYVTLGCKIYYGEENVTSKTNIDISNINVNILGEYKVKYIYEENNELYKTEIIIKVVDTERPEILLNDSREIKIYIDDKYKEYGAIAIDNYDGDITNKIEITGNVDTTKVGIYEVEYKITDSSGNTATAIRTVEVINEDEDGDASSKGRITLTLSGTDPTYIEHGSEYIEPGYKAIDTKDGNITSKVVVTGSVNTNELGTYNLAYSVTNSDNVTMTKTRKVIVRDKTGPVIEIDKTEVTIELGADYNLLTGVIVSDNYDSEQILLGRLKVTSIPEFDKNGEGIYTIYYNLKDTNGNNAKEIIRTITVIDTTAPTYIINGPFKDPDEETELIETTLGETIYYKIVVTDSNTYILDSSKIITINDFITIEAITGLGTIEDPYIIVIMPVTGKNGMTGIDILEGAFIDSANNESAAGTSDQFQVNAE